MFTRHISFLGVIFLLLATCMQAQGWRSRFLLTDSLDSKSRAIFEISPGNYIAAGFSDRLTIMGLNANGQPLWSKKYGIPKFQYLMNIFIQRSFYKKGLYIYHACCVKDSNNKQFGALIKFDLNGDTLWQKLYRDTLEDLIPQMVTGSVDGGFLITGFFQNWVNHTQPALLIKTDANGNELWRKRLHKVNPDVSDGKAILQDSITKKIIISGYQYQSGAFNYENILILDSLGNNPITTAFLSNGGTIFDMIQSRKDSSIIISGVQYEVQTLGGTNLERSYVVKFKLVNPNIPLWKVVIDKPTLNNFASALRELNSGELLLGGSIDTLQIENKPRNVLIRFCKISQTGALISKRYYDYKSYKLNDSTSFNNMWTPSFELCQDGGWVAGIYVVNSPSPNPFFFVKYDANGCDTLAAHCATMNVVGLKENMKSKTEVLISPNPFHTSFKVVMENYLDSTEFELTVRDLLGREIKKVTLFNNKDIDIHELKAGIYFLQVLKEGQLFLNQKVIKE